MCHEVPRVLNIFRNMAASKSKKRSLRESKDEHDTISGASPASKKRKLNVKGLLEKRMDLQKCKAKYQGELEKVKSKYDQLIAEKEEAIKKWIIDYESKSAEMDSTESQSALYSFCRVCFRSFDPDKLALCANDERSECGAVMCTDCRWQCAGPSCDTVYCDWCKDDSGDVDTARCGQELCTRNQCDYYHYKHCACLPRPHRLGCDCL